MRIAVRSFVAALVSITVAFLPASALRLSAEPHMGGTLTFTKAFGVASMPVGSTTTLTFSLVSNLPLSSGVAFTDPLPAGLVVATPNGLSTAACPLGASVTAVAGASSVNALVPILFVGIPCTFVVNVTGTAPGPQVNTTGQVSGAGVPIPGPTATASITIVAPPTLSKAFGTASMAVGASTTLTFTAQNTNAGTTLSGIGFNDTLPAGLTIPPPQTITGTCGGGTIGATASTVTLSNASLAASTSCTFGVTVTGTAAAVQVNTTSAPTSTQGGSGIAATASVTVTAPVPLMGPTTLGLLALLLAAAAVTLLRRRPIGSA